MHPPGAFKAVVNPETKEILERRSSRSCRRTYQPDHHGHGQQDPLYYIAKQTFTHPTMVENSNDLCDAFNDKTLEKSDSKVFSLRIHKQPLEMLLFSFHKESMGQNAFRISELHLKSLSQFLEPSPITSFKGTRTSEPDTEAAYEKRTKTRCAYCHGSAWSC